MMTPRWLIALVALLVLVLALWVGRDLGSDVAPSDPAPDPTAAPGPILEPKRASEADAAPPEPPVAKQPVPPRPARKEGEGALCLRLLYDDGTPGADLVLALDVRGEDEERGLTDAAGWYRTRQDDASKLDRVAVLDEEEEWVFGSEGPFVTQHDDPTCVVLVLPTAGRIRGRVWNLAGKPEADAEYEIQPIPVLSLDPAINELPRMGELEGEVADDGTFDVAVPIGTYRVRLRYVGSKLLAVAEVELTSTRRSVEVDLHLAGRVGGRTLVVHLKGLPDGHPPPRVGLVAKAELHVQDPRPRAGVVMVPVTPHRRQSRDKDDATYVFEHVEDIPWTLSIWAKGFELFRAPVPSGATEMTAVMQPKTADLSRRWIHGTVRDPQGAVAEALVGLEAPAHPGLRVSAFAYADGEGAFRVEHPEHDDLGAVYARVEVEGYTRSILGPLDLAATDAPLSVVLAAPRALQGQVVDRSGAGVGCYLVIRLADKEPPFPHVTRKATDGQGAFRFENLPPGPWELRAYPRDSAHPPARVRVEDGQTTVRLVAGEGFPDAFVATGTVRDATTGRPLAEAVVSIETEATDRQWEAMTGALGAYKMVLRPAGSIWFEVRHRGYAPEHGRRTVSAGGNRLDFELLPARTLHLRVLDEDGHARRGADVKLRRAGGGRVFAMNFGAIVHPDVQPVTDTRGRVDLHGLPATRVELFAGYPEEMDFDDVAKNPPDHVVDLTEPIRELVTITARR